MSKKLTFLPEGKGKRAALASAVVAVVLLIAAAIGYSNGWRPLPTDKEADRIAQEAQKKPSKKNGASNGVPSSLQTQLDVVPPKEASPARDAFKAPLPVHTGDRPVDETRNTVSPAVIPVPIPVLAKAEPKAPPTVKVVHRPVPVQTSAPPKAVVMSKNNPYQSLEPYRSFGKGEGEGVAYRYVNRTKAQLVALLRNPALWKKEFRVPCEVIVRQLAEIHNLPFEGCEGAAAAIERDPDFSVIACKSDGLRLVVYAKDGRSFGSWHRTCLAGEHMLAYKNVPVLSLTCLNPTLRPPTRVVTAALPPTVPPKGPCYTISFNTPPGKVRWGVGVTSAPLPPDECNAIRQGDNSWTAWYGECDICVPAIGYLQTTLGGSGFVPHRFLYEPIAQRQTIRFSSAALQAVVYICLESANGVHSCGVYMRPQDWNGRTHVEIPDSMWKYENCPE
jgi:hypothetical protein